MEKFLRANGRLLGTIVGCLGMGLVVSSGTSMLLGTEKAINLPGGSLAGALLFASFTYLLVQDEYHRLWEYAFFGLMAGLLGHALFVLIALS